MESASVSTKKEGKKITTAYPLWLFLGWLGAHRFYLGKYLSGLLMVSLFFFGWFAVGVSGVTMFFNIWLFWWILDVFLTYWYVKEYNQSIVAEQPLRSSTNDSAEESPDNLDKLERLYALYEKGAISKEQYESMKAALI